METESKKPKLIVLKEGLFYPVFLDFSTQGYAGFDVAKNSVLYSTPIAPRDLVFFGSFYMRTLKAIDDQDEGRFFKDEKIEMYKERTKRVNNSLKEIVTEAECMAQEVGADYFNVINYVDRLNRPHLELRLNRLKEIFSLGNCGESLTDKESFARTRKALDRGVEVFVHPTVNLYLKK